MPTLGRQLARFPKSEVRVCAYWSETIPNRSSFGAREAFVAVGTEVLFLTKLDITPGGYIESGKEAAGDIGTRGGPECRGSGRQPWRTRQSPDGHGKVRRD